MTATRVATMQVDNRRFGLIVAISHDSGCNRRLSRAPGRKSAPRSHPDAESTSEFYVRLTAVTRDLDDVTRARGVVSMGKCLGIHANGVASSDFVVRYSVAAAPRVLRGPARRCEEIGDEDVRVLFC